MKGGVMMWYRERPTIFRMTAFLICTSLMLLTGACMALIPTTTHESATQSLTTAVSPSGSTAESDPALSSESTREPDPTIPSETTTIMPTPEPTPTSSPSEEPVPTTASPAETETDTSAVYIVQAGDTLYQIAVRHGLTLSELITLNRISDPDLIYPGQSLLVRADQLIDLNTISNLARGWTYRAPSPLFQDIRATIPSDIESLLQRSAAIWQLPPTDIRTVYLTMDAGYEYHGNAASILTIAAEKNVHLTFFVTGSLIEHEPALVRRMVDEGHLVGNHTERHLNQPQTLQQSVDLVISDILTAEQRMIALTGQSLTPYLRPPSGAYSERSLVLLRQLGYQAVFWSFAYPDWQVDQQLDPQTAYDRIMG
ncbi:MAG: LysM peptidoglycan-binding domain-containing protein, partial [Clostridia bacterium]|nr:LysM peptidoglycan-binding domain-containing protein [Clostridia bacterium]